MLAKQFTGGAAGASFFVGRSAAWTAPTATIAIAAARPSFFIGTPIADAAETHADPRCRSSTFRGRRERAPDRLPMRGRPALPHGNTNTRVAPETPPPMTFS